MFQPLFNGRTLRLGTLAPWFTTVSPQWRAVSIAGGLTGRTVLVAGAAGFIGTHTCRHLTELGAVVHAVSRKAQTPMDVASVVRALLRNEPPERSSGVRPVDWVYVDDVVHGLVRLATSDDVTGLTVDLGSGRLVPVRDVVLHLAEIIGPDVEPVFGARPERAFEPVRRANVAETRERIGWEPTVGLDEGLERTVAWYAEHP